MKKNVYASVFASLPLLAILPLPSFAQLVISDTLTGESSSYGWEAKGGACLTAGKSGVASTIPACDGLAYYSGKTQVGGVSGRLPDPVGQGALRLTNGATNTGSNGNNNTGSVVSTTPFPTNQGVQVTFSTVTYGGNAYPNSAGQLSGADGIAFFLMDGTKPPSVGAYGGSLGYSCSQGKNPADGVDGGYLGVAIDEFGNFSNPGDNTSSGPGSRPGSIVVRGAGNITYNALSAAYPEYYPATGVSNSNKVVAVQNTCSRGTLQNWSGRTITDRNGRTVVSGTLGTTSEKVFNYNHMTTQAMTVPIYNQQATNMPVRDKANVLTYALSITQDGLLSLSYSANGGATIPVITKQSITEGNGPLPSSFRFGFTSGTGGGSNVHEITCFKAAPINSAASSAGSNVQQTSRVEAGSQVYLASYHPLNSWGQLTASDLVEDSVGNVSIATSANWDASCVLTGGACTATGASSGTAQASTARNIVTWSGSAGTPFKFDNLSSAQKNALGVTSSNSTRLDYLRGVRTAELTSAGVGTYRKRDGVLGDIINSSPVWVGYPSLPYADAGKDLLSKRTVAEFGAVYTKFASDNATRTNVVYSGSNDGMVHAFRAGAYNSAGSYVATNNDGRELMAFMPNAVVNSIYSSTNSLLDFSSAQYAHNSYVDATPGTGDLYYSGSWKTWLVGGLGPGGNAGGVIADETSTANGVLYALDITDPSKFSAEATASALVIGEWDSSNISCTNDSTCKDKLGSVFGTPLIRLLHDGNWAVIFGNGRNSKNGAAGIFIMTVDRASGARTFRYLDTGVSSTTNKNGIDFVTSADLDGDHVTDYIYAGDKLGNVWRFNLTSTNANSWAVGPKLFTTPTTSGSTQPISTAVTVASVLQSVGAPRILLAFGTGRKTPQTLTSGDAYASNTQSIYGIWDWQMAAWNALTDSASQYATLTSAQQSNQSYTIASTDLQAQTITDYSAGSGNVQGYRTVTQNKVCWKGSTVCGNAASSNTRFGWKLDLSTKSGEQVVFNPTIALGALFLNTSIPAVKQELSCSYTPAAGFTMALAIDTGGAPNSSFFDTAVRNAGITKPNTGIIAGIGQSGTGTPSIVTAKGKPFIVQQTVNNEGKVTQLDPPGNNVGKRITWVKLR